MKDGGPAFPRELPKIALPPDEAIKLKDEYSGMSLRDYFAAKAMQGDFACQTKEAGFINFEDRDQLMIGARNYYRFADAMLKARGE